MHSRAHLKHNYLSYNEARYNGFAANYSSEQKRLIRLLPLLLHTNVNLMPGFVSRHTPHGISGYTPDVYSLEQATRINQHFSYDPESPPRPTAIESLFIQQCFLTGEIIFWVIHDRHLDQNQIRLLNRKIADIIKWLGSAGIQMNYMVCNAASIPYSYYSMKKYRYHIDKCFFLDNFYAESIYLAGKIPAWWLYLKESEDDYPVIYCGELATPRANDYLSAAIWHLYNVYRHPLTSWINLAIIDQFISRKVHTFFSIDLRDMVHQSPDKTKIDTLQGYSIYLKDIVNIKHSDIDYSILDEYRENNLPMREITTVKQPLHNTVFSTIGKLKQMTDNETSITVEFNRYRHAMENLLHQCEQLFRRIKTYLNLTAPSPGHSDHNLHTITNGLLSRLIDTQNRIIPVNYSARFVLDRVHFRYQTSKQGNYWLLMSDDQGERQKIYQKKNLIHLVTWAFVNGLVDVSTQLSIHCEDFSIRQIDILNIIRTLKQNIDRNSLNEVDIDHFLSEPEPLQSMLFIGHHSKNFREQTIDHLIIYNTGEVRIYAYHGLHVFHNWFQSNPGQSVSACLYGAWSNDYRSLNRKILSRIDHIAIN
jgi:adenylate cyclase